MINEMAAALMHSVERHGMRRRHASWRRLCAAYARSRGNDDDDHIRGAYLSAYRNFARSRASCAHL